VLHEHSQGNLLVPVGYGIILGKPFKYDTMQLAANLSDTIAREMCHRKSETFAKNYFTFDPS